MSEEPELEIAQTSPELRSFWRSGKHWSTNEERPATNGELSSDEVLSHLAENGTCSIKVLFYDWDK